MTNGFVHQKECPECGKKIDAALSPCPSCRHAFDDLASKRFARLFPVGTYRELALFLIGWAGFQIIGTIFYVIALANAESVLSGAGLYGGSLQQGIADYFSSPAFNAFVNYWSYAVLFAALIIVMYPELKRLWPSFRNWRPYVYGLLMGLALIGTSLLWGLVVSAVGGSTGDNQSTVIAITMESPILAVVFTGIIGPICEEFAYRVGLFNLGMRIHPVVAYLFASLLFGLIHMQDFTSANEWLNFPSYLIAGGILALTYHRFGLVSSMTAHVFNNLIAIVSIFLA